MPSHQYADNYVGMQLGGHKDKTESSRTAIDAKNNRFLDRKMVSRKGGWWAKKEKQTDNKIHKEGRNWSLSSYRT